MTMYLERVGVRFVAAMAVLLAVAGNAAFAQEHKTYRCKVVDVVHSGKDGRLHAGRPWLRATAMPATDWPDVMRARQLGQF